MTDIPRADALVIFGATGDLAKRKILPALYQLACRDLLDMPVVGVSRSTDDDEQFRTHVRDSVTAAVEDVDQKVLDRFLGRIHLVCGDYADRATFDALASVLAEDDTKLPVFYLAIPPSQFEVVIESLSGVGLTDAGRIVVEKPFGRDLASARELNEVLHAHLPEDRIFRIDHYLGKEAVEDLLIFRFANTFLEPIWNRNYVESVQITMAESIDVEGRGSFYDSVGTLRDVVQNHLLQVVALLAMEPPVGPEAGHMSDEKAKVFTAMRSIDPTRVVRGQYVGYLDEPGVAEGSTTETYVACPLAIESWRWAGVPFYIRAGKALGASATEAVITLRRPPAMLFGGNRLLHENEPSANVIRFRLGSSDGVTMTVNAKQPGPELDAKEVDLSVDFAAALGLRQEPYERLIGDALDGNLRRFGREDIVEETWRVVQPVLHHPGPIRHYERGTWGPEAADAIINDGDWVAPGFDVPWQRRIEVTPDELATATATRLATAIDEAVAARGVCHLAVSGGRTPWESFAELATMSLPWSHVEFWQVDERIAPADDPARNSIGIRRTLVDPLGLAPAQVHLMDVAAADVDEAAVRYAADLADSCRGVLDLVHLGLGPDGHTASWVPGDPVIDSADDVGVTATEYQGRRRMTLTPPCVNRARARLMELAGAEKVDALRLFLEGDPSVPASRLNPMTTVIDATGGG